MRKFDSPLFGSRDIIDADVSQLPEADSSTLFLWHHFPKLRHKRIAEVGSTSGAMAILLAAGNRIIASDIVPAATRTIQTNADLNRIDLKVIQSNLFDQYPLPWCGIGLSRP